VAPVEDWTIDVDLIAWRFFYDDPQPPAPCDVSLNKTTVNNGTKVKLTVKANSAAVAGSWCAIRIISSVSPLDQGNDISRYWVTGVKWNP
jgi:hypothetical protein